MTEPMITLVKRMEFLPENRQRMYAELFLQQIEEDLKPTLAATDELESLLSEARNEIKAGSVLDMEAVFDAIQSKREIF